MQELATLSTQIHVISIFLTILVVLFLYITFVTHHEYIKLTKLYEKYSLFYFFFLSVNIFTGIILWTIMKFHFSFKIVLMNLAVLYIIFTSIKLRIFFKKSKVFIKQSQINFHKYTRKKYFLDMLVLLLVGCISYAIHI